MAQSTKAAKIIQTNLPSRGAITQRMYINSNRTLVLRQIKEGAMSWYYGRKKVKTYRPLKSIPSIETGRDSESRGNLEHAADHDKEVGEELSQRIG
jgi:hypothetical protein